MKAISISSFTNGLQKINSFYEETESKYFAFWQENKTLLWQCFAITFALGLITHAFIYFNPSFSHDSLAIQDSTQNGWDSSIGRFFTPVIRLLYGGYEVTWLIGIWSLFFISLAVFFTSRLFKDNSIKFILIVSSVCVINQSLILWNATYIFFSLSQIFGFFSAILAVFFWKNKVKYYIFLSGSFIAISMSCYQCHVNDAIGLAIILILIDCIHGDNFNENIRKGIIFCCILIIGAIFYYFLWKLVQFKYPAPTHYFGFDKIGDYSETSVAQSIYNTYYNFFDYFFGTKKFYGHGLFFFNIIIFITMLITLYNIIKNLSKKIIILIGLLIIILPFGLNFSNFISKTLCSDYVRYSFNLSYIFCFYLFFHYNYSYKIIPKLMCFLIIVISIRGIAISNIIYLKKFVEYDNTMIHAGRILARIEAIQNFDPQKHTIYIEKLVTNNYLAGNKTAFANFYNYTGLGETLSSTWCSHQYFRNFNLNYNVSNVYSSADVKNLEKTHPGISQKINAMPPFPHKNSVKLIDNIIYVRLSNEKY